MSGNQVFAPEARIISTSAIREIMATFGKDRLAQHLSNLESIHQSIDELEGKIQRVTDEKLKREMQWENASDREYLKTLPNLI